MKAHRGLLDKIDPKLTRMVIGAEAEQAGDDNPALGIYSYAARSYLKNQRVDPYSDQTYLDSKSLDEGALELVAQQGWQMYDQLTNWLQYQADQKGLATYEQDPALAEMRK